MSRIAVVLAALAVAACAQNPVSWETAKSRAAAAVDSGDCARAWDLLWPWARDGRIGARTILSGGVVAAGLVPPGGSGDAISQFRHAVVLSVHGAAGGDPETIEVLRALVRTDLVARMGGRALMRCLDGGNPPRGCVAEAVVAGFVPDFESYAREIDAAGGAARCTRAGTMDVPQPQ